MKKIFITLILSFCCLVGWAQSFEGLVVYHCSYKSKMQNVTDEQLTTWAGPTLNYYMKGGDYRSDIPGGYFQWQIYSNKDNKMYNKNVKSDTISWNDGAVNTDTLYSTKLNKGVCEILGYTCDELIFVSKSGTTKYYYSSKVPIDSKLYAKQVFQNWYAYLKIANAMPLQMICDNKQATEVMTAISVTDTKLDDALFKLPEGAILTQSPQ